MERPDLAPTLWRTCRVLANTRRLDLVRAMVGHPPQTVTELSRRCGQSFTLCCQYLRLLQSRGLCRAARHGRWVSYELRADPAVRNSPEILDALVRELSRPDAELARILKALTACTHPRRVEMLARLRAAPDQTTDALRAATRISYAALCRHLDKLERRGFVRWKSARVELLEPTGALEQALLDACGRD